MSWAEAAAMAATAAGKAGEAIAGGQASKYAAKKKAKEDKRKTLAELLNAALNREQEAGEGQRKRGAELAGARANALQNAASQYVQALR